MGPLGSARAQTAPIRAGAVALEVLSEASIAAVCPDDSDLRGLVATRLGSDPFVDGTPDRIVVHLGARPRRRIRAVVTIVRSGAIVGERTLEDRDCGEAVEAAAVLLTLLIDVPASASTSARDEVPPPPAPSSGASEAVSDGPPLSVDPPGGPVIEPVIELAAPTESPPVNSATPEAVALDVPVTESPAPSERSVVGVAIAGVGIVVGWLPEPSLLLRAGLGVGGRDWLVRVEARGAFDVSLATDRGAATLSWAGGVAAGCGRLFEILDLCGAVTLARSAGVARALAAPASDQALALGLGASAAAGWAPVPWLRLELEAQLDVPILRPEAWLDGHRVWQAPPVAGQLSLAISPIWR